MSKTYQTQTQSIESVYRIIKIEIHLTKVQKEMAMSILFHCHRLWNLYVERA